MRVVIAGVGSSLHSYDSVGLLVAERLKHRLAGKVDVKEIEGDYITLVHEIAGYDAAIIVDAILDECSELLVVHIEDLPATNFYLTHGIDLRSAIDMARACMHDLPNIILLVGIPISASASCEMPLSSDILKLCDEATSLVAEMAEVLADGG